MPLPRRPVNVGHGDMRPLAAAAGRTRPRHPPLHDQTARLDGKKHQCRTKRDIQYENDLTHLPRLQKTSGGSTASSSEDVLGGDGDDVLEDIVGPDAEAAAIAGPRTAAGVPTRAADAAEDGCIAESHLKLKQKQSLTHMHRIRLFIEHVCQLEFRWGESTSD